MPDEIFDNPDLITVEYCHEPDEPGAVHEPTHDEIALAAFHTWEGNGKPDGTAHQDWVAAETELWLNYMDKISQHQHPDAA